MKKPTLLLLFISLVVNLSAQHAPLKYTVNLNDLTDDQFKVTLAVSGLTDKNDIYQFASTAPGTYQVMDIGRFVREFKAFDKKGKEIATSRLSDNQFKLTSPKKVAKIVYSIAETWDTKVDKNRVYLMCGSSIEKDNVLINGQCVFGYPKGMQGTALEIKLDYPSTWTAGTALSKNKEGNYYAETYDKVVDSPILLGNLTQATTKLGKASVEIYTYSKTNLIQSEQLLNSMKTMLNAADAFIGGLPMDRYTFLFHFEDQSEGAWEHSYSSEYVMREEPFTEEFGKQITSTAAHEFFHCVTPLNIHSEIIEQFNFVTPTPSRHLWLYEGTTEWASDLMQLRSGMIDLDTYFSELVTKLSINTRLDTNYSLLKLSLTSYTPEGQRQYGNIYMRGAVVAGLLDIRLLNLSHGTRGLREVIQELAKKYGPKKAFNDSTFFKDFTAMTCPEIASFFDSYVINTNPLPLKEYYATLGIRYEHNYKTGKMISSIGTSFDFVDGKFVLKTLRPGFKEFGFSEGDEVAKINDQPLTIDNIRQVVGKLRNEPAGTGYTITVRRSGADTDIKGQVLSVEEVKPYYFAVDPTATEQQNALRKIWMKNL